ncbi:venom dipeptidyl peptidase 4 [Nasonia vitripennis]|uniref:Venom dipeptidyl peptidase 4 n=1 Tax=Nasonia vitripennis TaxID=7425 RepID=A0A7M7Q3U4_NASVI|nr:venom dipeptidyl peptidase 4 [Nasonia vitripennis]
MKFYSCQFLVKQKDFVHGAQAYPQSLLFVQSFWELCEYYFTTASWISPMEICITWMNRPQNLSVVSICKSPLWKCNEIQKVVGETHGWVDTPPESPIFSINGSSYIAISPVRDGPAGFYKHIVWVNVLNQKIVPLTHGKFEVTRILAWDQINNTIYFMAIPSNNPSQRHLYCVSSLIPRIGNSMHAAVCLSCRSMNQRTNHIFMDFISARSTVTERAAHAKYIDVLIGEEKHKDDVSVPVIPAKTLNESRRKGERSKLPKTLETCQYFNAIFSPNLDYFVLECLGPGIPTVALYKTETPMPRFLTLLQNNTLLKERISHLALPQIKTFPVQISGGYNAQVRLYLPPGLREDEITRYPLVVQVYGAPGSQLVTDVFKIDWNVYLSSRKNIIIAQIDGRGSGGQGYQLLHEVYKRLGTVEITDQLEVTEYLRDSLHFVDKRRVAVWGWSYGGFVAAHVLAHADQDVFHCGISVAPIVSWKLYDSAYAERYMGSPNFTANYQGYVEADLSNKVEHLRNRMFYLIHGTADDNVQFQQSMVLVRSMAKKGILFRQQVYPDVSHSLAGVKEHLYLSMAQFLDDCFLKQVPVDSKAGLSSGGSTA